MSTFENLHQTADDDVRSIVGTDKPASDSTIDTNVDVEIARDHLDDIEERNATTIKILEDTVNATESKDLTDRELKILSTSLKAITGEKFIKSVAQESGDNRPSNRSIALEGFKETLKKFWNYIKEQVKKFWNLMKRWWLRTFDISKRAKSRAEKLMDKADNEYGTSVESEIHFREIKKLAINGRINDNIAMLKGIRDLEEVVFEFVNPQTTDRFNDTAEALSDKTIEMINGVKTLADEIISKRGENAQLGRNELSLRTVDLNTFTEIVERCFARTDSDLVDMHDFGMDKADKYLKQYSDNDKAIFRHSKYLPGDKWVLCVRPATKKELGHTVELTETIDALRRSRLVVAPCLYTDKQYDPDPAVKVLNTSTISRGCESIVKICEYVNEYRKAFERRDKFKERMIKDIDQAVNDVSEESNGAYSECDRLIRSFANAITGLLRRRTDFETSLCAYSMSTSVAFLNYSELSLKQYTK